MDKPSSTVCVLIVALCALVHFGTVFSLVRPDILIGECPWRLNLALTRMGCEDCPTDHTCCVYDGEEVCLPSVSPKPGVCPLMRSEVGPCVESCSYDSDCPNNEKCCSNGCGHHCIEPYLVLPAKPECPQHLNFALSRKGCEDCPTDHICCVYNGEEVCVPTVFTKPGVCPRRLLPVAFGPCVEACSYDSDCPDNEKCCSSGCGHECMAPVSVLPPKPECPQDLNFALSRKGCEDCPTDHICCVYNGEEVCVPTVFTKPGVCPLMRSEVGPCVASCSYDSDCPNNEKCCSTGCGRHCIEPYPVLPPKPECPQHLNFALSRKGCEDCPTDHICCVYNGEEVCVPTVFTKPGVCPRRLPPVAFGPCVESCSYDSDCPNYEKCCSNGCGRHCIEPYPVLPPKPECPQHLNFALSRKGCEDCPTDHICCVYNGEEVCVPTVFTKPGVCPRRLLPVAFGPCVEACSYDSDCPDNEKCCSSGCGHECMAPVSVLPAKPECPQHLNFALLREGCEDCPTDHICCVYNGEEVCVPTVFTKPGVCPRRLLPVAFGPCVEACSYDSDCPDNEKCCFSGCGHECMAPVSVLPPKPECPQDLNFALSRKGCEDCPTDHICCVYNGEEVCVPTVFTKPGVCPLMRSEVGPCVASCSYDSDCPNNEKCCSTGCGRHCIEPYPVLPPKPECPQHLNFALSRKGCEDCPTDHICCVYNGEEVCVPTVFTKPGVCPRRLPPVAFGPCVESCSYDSDCPNYEKCCSNGCGRHCIEPYPVLPPKPECPQHLNFALSRKGCEDCPTDHICCVYNGEEVCVPTVFTKPGVCPRRLLPVAFGPCVEACSYDSDCPDNEKCCSSGCGRECMAPVSVLPPKPECPQHLNFALSRKGCEDCPTDHICCVYNGEEVCVPTVFTKPGVCPRRLPPVAFGPCVESCSYDSDCPNYEKCCSNGCGRQCIEPYLVWPVALV